MDAMPICECATFWGSHHPECPVRNEIESLRAELAELRRFRKVIMDHDSNLYDALADSDAAHKGEGEA